MSKTYTGFIALECQNIWKPLQDCPVFVDEETVKLWVSKHHPEYTENTSMLRQVGDDNVVKSFEKTTPYYIGVVVTDPHVQG